VYAYKTLTVGEQKRLKSLAAQLRKANRDNSVVVGIRLHNTIVAMCKAAGVPELAATYIG